MIERSYSLYILLLASLLINSNNLFAQSVEDFESEFGTSATFTDVSQTFTVSSMTGEGYNIFSNGTVDNGSTDTGNGYGWNGTATDNKFLDNSGPNNDDNVDGSSFTIKTGGSEIGVTSLYLFCATRGLATHAGDLTIVGKKSGVTQYTITLTSGWSGWSNVTTFTPNNGFSFIDFATEGSSDFTQIKIDELVFTSTNNLDYMALDAFSWAPGNTLSINHFEAALNNIKIYPNPTTDFIIISGLNKKVAYTIYNILGEIILEGTVTNNDKISSQALVSGVYFLKLNTGNSVKFIKQ
ncbi:MAG: T9SS type A sorting domain-containing protein [Flavobacteriaceae bacterium]|nr:T9SS type A sorting domain-containing protein [Flavobacteriaceae bacterium]